MEPGVTLPRVNAVEARRQLAGKESEGLRIGRSLLESSRHLSKISSIKVVMSAVEGLSGVMARMNALWRGRSQPGTHVGDRRSSVQRSWLRMRISDMAALTDRVSCCAPAALCTDAGKGRVEMRATSFRPSVAFHAQVRVLPTTSFVR